MMDEATLKSLVLSILKPEVERINGNVASALASMKKVSSSAIGYQSSVVASVKAMLLSFRTEFLSSLGSDKRHPGVADKQPSRTCESNINESPVPNANPVDPSAAHDANDVIIENVMENLSHYSTPPRSSNRHLVSISASILYFIASLPIITLFYFTLFSCLLFGKFRNRCIRFYTY